MEEKPIQTRMSNAKLTKLDLCRTRKSWSVFKKTTGLRDNRKSIFKVDSVTNSGSFQEKRYNDGGLRWKSVELNGVCGATQSISAGVIIIILGYLDKAPPL